MSSTRILLVRHGRTKAVGRRLLGRGPCPGVDERGAAQATALADRLAGEPLQAVYSSPMLRTRQTAERIAQRHSLEVITHEAFGEIDFGGWTGREFDELDSDPVWQEFNRLRSLTRVPGGELMLEVQARAIAGLIELRREHDGDGIVIVTHADVIRGIVGHVLGMPTDNLLRLAIEPASVSTIVFHATQPQLTGLNRTL